MANRADGSDKRVIARWLATGAVLVVLGITCLACFAYAYRFATYDPVVALEPRVIAAREDAERAWREPVYRPPLRWPLRDGSATQLAIDAAQSIRSELSAPIRAGWDEYFRTGRVEGARTLFEEEGVHLDAMRDATHARFAAQPDWPWAIGDEATDTMARFKLAVRLSILRAVTRPPQECLEEVADALRLLEDVRVYDAHADSEATIAIERCARSASPTERAAATRELDVLVSSGPSIGFFVEAMQIPLVPYPSGEDPLKNPAVLVPWFYGRRRLLAEASEAERRLARNPARFRALRAACLPECLVELRRDMTPHELDRFQLDEGWLNNEIMHQARLRALAAMLRIAAGETEHDVLVKSIDPADGAPLELVERNGRRAVRATGVRRNDPRDDVFVRLPE